MLQPNELPSEYSFEPDRIVCYLDGKFATNFTEPFPDDQPHIEDPTRGCPPPRHARPLRYKPSLIAHRP